MCIEYAMEWPTQSSTSRRRVELNINISAHVVGSVSPVQFIMYQLVANVDERMRRYSMATPSCWLETICKLSQTGAFKELTAYRFCCLATILYITVITKKYLVFFLHCVLKVKNFLLCFLLSAHIKDLRWDHIVFVISDLRRYWTIRI